MTSASLLCRVQALYPFESNDPSSLRFEEGDYIDVLARLPSGWWDGWCNGNRGWFPSNFVKVIEDYSSSSNTGIASSSSAKKHSKRLSTDVYEERIGLDVNKRTSLPPNWSIQNREDGSASYYFNTVTGEMRATYPYDDSNSIYEGESDEDSATSTIDSNSRTESVLDVNFLPSDETLVASDHSQQGKWIQRTTPQGLPFFYNLSTHETAWHAEDQQGSPKSQPRSPIAIKNNTFPLQPSPSFDNHDSLTWNKLSLHVVLTINNLIASAKNTQRSLYKKYAASVVEAVRFMLVASGTINKESVHIKSNNVLRSQHRAMLASMSKLVLSAQLCADGTVTDVSKLLSDCQELLAAVRNFVQSCETIPVEVHQVDPTLLHHHEEKTAPWDPSMRRLSSGTGSVIDQAIRAKYELQPELIENLEAYGSSMHESMETLMTHLTCPTESRASLAVSLFSQYRSFGNQNGQFLSIIEDIEFEAVITCPLMKDLAIAKQKLYDGLGLLFFKMQTLTDEAVPLEKVTHEIQASAQSITEAIKSLCECISGLVAEKQKRNSILETTEKHPFSDFLRNSTGSNDLSFDLNLSSSITLKNPTLEELHRLSANSKRSQSLSVETNHRNIPTSSSSTKLNRSSAPVSDGNSSMMMAEAMKHRSHTLNEAQSKQATAKLKNFLEESSDPTSPTSRKSSSSTPEEEQRYLQYDYSPNEVVFTTEGMVKGGTLRALVERMTLHDYLDMNFNSTFLLTYRSFCTSMELLELLEARYNIQPPTDLTPEELEIWINKKQKLIRLRVFNVLKIWLEQYYYEEDSVILDRLLFFTNTSIKDSLSFSAIQLERLIHKRKEACKDLKKLVITQPQDSPEPILPRNLKKFKLLDLDPIELARQLTLMDFKMYSSIKPVECLDKAWSKDAAATNHIAANIQASIDYCNRVTTWVSDEILSQSEVKKRSTLIKYWVNVADRCRMLNNFNTCMAILSAFDNSAVGRLKRTWELVGARTHHIVAQIRKLMGANRNFNNYRAIIHSINPPCIPFLGIYLQDLTFIEDGNPNFLKTSKDLINFAKRAKTGEVIREIQQYQTMGYQFRPVDELQNFISENLHSSRDEDQLYKESLKLEPKEREDEKITRLLQESGFL